jgi:hypothetical protein
MVKDTWLPMTGGSGNSTTSEGLNGAVAASQASQVKAAAERAHVTTSSAISAADCICVSLFLEVLKVISQRVEPANPSKCMNSSLHMQAHAGLDRSKAQSADDTTLGGPVRFTVKRGRGVCTADVGLQSDKWKISLSGVFYLGKIHTGRSVARAAHATQ